MPWTNYSTDISLTNFTDVRMLWDVLQNALESGDVTPVFGVDDVVRWLAFSPLSGAASRFRRDQAGHRYSCHVPVTHGSTVSWRLAPGSSTGEHWTVATGSNLDAIPSSPSQHNTSKPNHLAPSDPPQHFTSVKLDVSKMDDMPGLELFNSYEQEFNDLVISLRNALNVEVKNLVGGTSLSLFSHNSFTFIMHWFWFYWLSTRAT